MQFEMSTWHILWSDRTAGLYIPIPIFWLAVGGEGYSTLYDIISHFVSSTGFTHHFYKKFKGPLKGPEGKWSPSGRAISLCLLSKWLLYIFCAFFCNWGPEIGIFIKTLGKILWISHLACHILERKCHKQVHHWLIWEKKNSSLASLGINCILQRILCPQ